MVRLGLPQQTHLKKHENKQTKIIVHTPILSLNNEIEEQCPLVYTKKI
jgi:hypothetical protein